MDARKSTIVAPLMFMLLSAASARISSQIAEGTPLKST